jgi:hypothetical protein
MPASYSSRGFACYARLTDSYGADVQVNESSAATIEGEDRGPWVWIMITGGGITDNEGSAHLDIRDAVKVRDALTEFIDENSAT